MSEIRVACPGVSVGLCGFVVPRRGEGPLVWALVVALGLWMTTALAAPLAAIALALADGLPEPPTIAQASTGAVFVIFIWVVVAGALLTGIAHLRRTRG